MLTETTRRRRLASIAALGTAALILSAALTAAALAAGHGASANAVVKTRKTTLGTILVDARGRTLYLFTKDKRNKSACSGPCASNWPPLITNGKPAAGVGTRASLLGITRRPDGRRQVTYNGHALYRFAQDSKAGQTTGEALNAFGGNWYAVSRAGAKVMPAGSAGGGSGGGGYGGGSGGGGYGG